MKCHSRLKRSSKWWSVVLILKLSMKCHSYPYTCLKRSSKWIPLFHIFMLSSKLLWGISVISSQVFKFQYVPFVYKKLIDHFIMTKKILKLSIHHFCFLRLWYIICCIVFDLSSTCRCSQFFEVLNIFANNKKLVFFSEHTQWL